MARAAASHRWQTWPGKKEEEEEEVIEGQRDGRGGLGGGVGGSRTWHRLDDDLSLLVYCLSPLTRLLGLL